MIDYSSLRDNSPLFDSDGVIVEQKEYDPLGKWKLQACAREILARTKISRVTGCLRHVIKRTKDVQVKHKEGQKAYYANLQRCGSIWTCAPCATKIQTVRTQNIARLIENFLGIALLITQTVPHSSQDRLDLLLGSFLEAIHAFKKGRSWIALKKQFGIVGYVRALEVTWSPRNGWHPHSHTIFLFDKSVIFDKLKTTLFKQWQNVASNAGFSDLSIDAFDVQDARGVKKYLTKMGTVYNWGTAEEVTRFHSKKGGVDRLVPFDFLRRFYEGTNPDLFEGLFKEYAKCFKNKRHLNSSKHLFKLIGPSDEEIAQSIKEDDPIGASIPVSLWQQVDKIASFSQLHRGWQGQALEIYEEFGEKELLIYLKSLIDS